MCGILGYSVSSEFSKEIFQELETGIKFLDHRGPDHSAVWSNEDNSLGMAHSRLSIIDLSIHGNQPMINEEDNLIISFNGEVYNFLELRKDLESLGYSFSSDSDTEVILKGYSQWNKEIFNKLRGMFAISIYDLETNEIVLARDHSGQKPLFYSFNKRNGNFIFSSELKGLLNFNIFSKCISFDGLSKLFLNGFCGGAMSIYDEANKLEAGHYLSLNFKTNIIETRKFWCVERIIKKKNAKKISENDLLTKLETLLEESIAMQLHADVPVGLLLSGGVDSSLIVALASRIKTNLNTYTVRFKDYKEYDESEHARLIANSFQTNHTELDASELDPRIFDQLAYFYDEPIFDTSSVPTFLLSKEISKHCKVALGGDGADELFGGYPHYDKLLRVKNASKYIPYPIRNSLSTILQNTLPIGFRGKKTLEFFGTDLNASYPNTGEFFSKAEQSKLFNLDFLKGLDSDLNNTMNASIFESLVDTATCQDFKRYLREDILVKVDRASMANSLEIRSPFLDHKIIEFAFQEVPSSLKVDQHNRKILLKKLAAKVLPKSFNFERKQGFSIPLKDLILSQEWVEYFQWKIESSDPNIFNHEYALALLNNQNSYSNNAERMAGLVVFMIWVEKFQPTF